MAAWTKEGEVSSYTTAGRRPVAVDTTETLGSETRGSVWGLQGGFRWTGDFSDEWVDDEGEIHLLLSKGLQGSPWKVTGWYSKGMLTQPKFPKEITIGHHAYWELCHPHPSQNHEQALWPFPPFCSQHGETGRQEESDRVSSMLPSNKEPYIHPEKSFFLLSTKVIRGLSLLPKLLTKISQQCVSLAFLNPTDDNKVS